MLRKCTTFAHRAPPPARAGAPAAGSAPGQPHTLVHDVQLAVAHSTQTVFYIMAGVMAATFLVAVRRVPRGRVEMAEAPVSAELPSLDLTAPDLVTRSGR